MKVKLNGETRNIHTLWREGSQVKMIDQRLLPHKLEIITLNTHEQTAKAIKDMVTRGAGAIGCAAGYGMAQAALESQNFELDEFEKYIHNAAETIKGTRPTAVNLFHSVNRCLSVAVKGSVKERVEKIVMEADIISEDDLKASLRMGEHGEKLIKTGSRILTHCNAGALAFVDYGTALSPIRIAYSEGKHVFVWVDETRPRCQGSRLTAWELQQEGIPYAVIVDNAAGYFMGKGEVDMVIVGADRIAANGDVANKIGTYEKAVMAKENDIPFYVAAPRATFDLDTTSGDEIEIEERDPSEIIMIWGLDDEGKTGKVRVTTEDTPARNPAFDITPARYVTAFITEKGILEPPFQKSISKAFAESN